MAAKKIKLTGYVAAFGGNASGQTLKLSNVKIKQGDASNLLELSALPAKKREAIEVTLSVLQQTFDGMQ